MKKKYPRSLFPSAVWQGKKDREEIKTFDILISPRLGEEIKMSGKKKDIGAPLFHTVLQRLKRSSARKKDQLEIKHLKDIRVVRD